MANEGSQNLQRKEIRLHPKPDIAIDQPGNHCAGVNGFPAESI